MPSTYKIRWSVPALNDLQRLHDFLKPKNKAAADRAVSQIKAIVKKLEEAPLIGTELSSDDPRREVYPRFGKYGYTVRYSVDENARVVNILRVWHGLENREDRA